METQEIQKSPSQSSRSANSAQSFEIAHPLIPDSNSPKEASPAEAAEETAEAGLGDVEASAPLVLPVEGRSVGATPPPARNVAIDGFRTMLALWIVMLHKEWTTHVPGYPGTPPLAQGLLNMERRAVAVDIFFVVSGFAVGGSKPPSSMLEKKIWMGKRFLRLVPSYYVSLIWWLMNALFWPTRTTLCRLGPPQALPLVLLMMQALWPYNTTPDGAPPAHCCPGSYITNITTNVTEWEPFSLPCWNTGYVGYIPFAINGQTWFVSSLMFIFAIYALVAERLMPATLSAKGCLIGALVCAFIYAFGFPWVSAFCAMKPDSNGWFPFPRSLFGRGMDEGFSYHFPLFNFPLFMMGAYTSVFAKRSKAENWGLHSMKIWYIVDLVIVAAALVAILLRSLGNASDRGLPVTPFLWALLIFTSTCDNKGIFMQLCSSSVLVTLGASSFEVYLFFENVFHDFQSMQWISAGARGGAGQNPSLFLFYVLTVFLVSAVFESVVATPAVKVMNARLMRAAA